MQWLIGRIIKNYKKNLQNFQIDKNEETQDYLNLGTAMFQKFASILVGQPKLLFARKNTCKYFQFETFCILVHLHLLFTKSVWSGILVAGGGAPSLPPSDIPCCLQLLLQSAAEKCCSARLRNTVRHSWEILFGTAEKYSLACNVPDRSVPQRSSTNINLSKVLQYRFAAPASAAAWHS